jgi:hypothetical protein
MIILHTNTGKYQGLLFFRGVNQDERIFRYEWPDVHLDYMATRMFDHGQCGFGTFIRGFKWARSNYKNPGC